MLLALDSCYSGRPICHRIYALHAEIEAVQSFELEPNDIVLFTRGKGFKRHLQKVRLGFLLFHIIEEADDRRSASWGIALIAEERNWGIFTDLRIHRHD